MEERERHGRPEKIRAHIGEEKARLDFRWEGSIARILPDVSAELRRIVESGIPIASRFEDEGAEFTGREGDGAIQHRRVETGPAD